jgi:RNA polymerase sigma-70 factor (ECF subfamily)
MSEADWVSLIRSIAEGNQQALHTVYEKTHRVVFTLMVRVAKNQTLAEELTFDVFHELWLKASKFNPARESSAVAWIMNIARAKAIERLRSDQRSSSAPHKAVARDIAARFLREAVARLDDDERQSIETAFFSELHYIEVAERLGKPADTVRQQIRSGMRKIRKAFSEAMKSL